MTQRRRSAGRACRVCRMYMMSRTVTDSMTMSRTCARLQGVQVVDHDSDRPADARQVGEEPRQRAAAGKNFTREFYKSRDREFIGDLTTSLTTFS